MKNQRLSLQLNKSAPGTEGWQRMLQVPSTSQDQLRDQYDDMIQFHDGSQDVDWSCSVLCVSDVYNNAAQAALLMWAHFIYDRSLVSIQTDPPGGNYLKYFVYIIQKRFPAWGGHEVIKDLNITSRHNKQNKTKPSKMHHPIDQSVNRSTNISTARSVFNLV